ncbi:hypothetical protein [Microbulbifer agarilyticus]
MTKVLYLIAIFLYALSLVLPHEGVWFFGLTMALMTAIFSVGVMFSLGLDDFTSVKGILFLLFVLSPFYNLVFMWCAFSFVKIEKKFETKNIILFVTAIFSVFVSARMFLENFTDFWIYFLWSLSLSFLSVAAVFKARNA